MDRHKAKDKQQDAALAWRNEAQFAHTHRTRASCLCSQYPCKFTVQLQISKTHRRRRRRHIIAERLHRICALATALLALSHRAAAAAAAVAEAITTTSVSISRCFAFFWLLSNIVVCVQLISLHYITNS